MMKYFILWWVLINDWIKLYMIKYLLVIYVYYDIVHMTIQSFHYQIQHLNDVVQKFYLRLDIKFNLFFLNEHR